MVEGIQHFSPILEQFNEKKKLLTIHYWHYYKIKRSTVTIHLGIVDEELLILASTEDALVVWTHGKAVDMMCLWFNFHSNWFWFPFIIQGFDRRPEKNPTFVTARYEPRPIVREFNDMDCITIVLVNKITTAQRLFGWNPIGREFVEVTVVGNWWSNRTRPFSFTIWFVYFSLFGLWTPAFSIGINSELLYWIKRAINHQDTKIIDN